jgi:small subunit ribosomal protein S13
MSFYKINNVKKYFLRKFGVNFKTLFKLYLRYGLNNRLNNNLNFKKKHISSFNTQIKTKLTGKNLKLKIRKNIDFYKRIKNVKGLRHKMNYPVRGQRTHTNAKTRKKIKDGIKFLI